MNERKLANLACLKADLELGESRLTAGPPVVSLFTTEVCNLRCVMCERSRKLGTRKLDPEALSRVLDELFPTAIKCYVVGSLGEPMLGDFDLILEKALEHDVKLDLVTNGTLLSATRYREMRGAMVRVNVSLDAHVKDVYERIRVGAHFESVQRRLREVTEERRRHPDGVVFDLSAILMRSNYRLLPDFVAFAAELGVDHVHIQALRHFGVEIAEEELHPEPDARVRLDQSGGRPAFEQKGHLLEVLEPIAEAAHRYRMNVDFGDFGLPPIVYREVSTKLDGLGVPGGVCWAVATNFGLQWNGDVYPCCHPTDYRLGNVLETSALDIWHGEAAVRLRRDHLARKRIRYCSGCVEAPYLGASDDGRLAALWGQARLGWSHLQSKVQEGRRAMLRPGGRPGKGRGASEAAQSSSPG